MHLLGLLHFYMVSLPAIGFYYVLNNLNCIPRYNLLVSLPAISIPNVVGTDRAFIACCNFLFGMAFLFLHYHYGSRYYMVMGHITLQSCEHL